MRAAYTNGALAAWQDAGLRPFDAVYGTSAGGALAAWWSAGQARYALKTWDYAADRRVLSWSRWLTFRGPLLDHDALFDVVYRREHPLDVNAVRRAPHPVVVVSTEADTGQAVYVDLRRGSIIDWLRATGRLPFAAGHSVEIDGNRYLDGGLADPVPIRRAIEDGATDIVLLLNGPPGRREQEPVWVARLVERRYPVVAPLIARHHELHNAAVKLAERPPPGISVRIVRPVTPLGVGRLTRNLARIHAAIRRGEEDGRKVVPSDLGGEPAPRGPLAVQPAN